MSDVKTAFRSDHIVVETKLTDVEGWFPPGASDFDRAKVTASLKKDLAATNEAIARVLDLAVSSGPFVGMFLNMYQDALKEAARTYEKVVDAWENGADPQDIIMQYALQKWGK